MRPLSGIRVAPAPLLVLVGPPSEVVVLSEPSVAVLPLASPVAALLGAEVMVVGKSEVKGASETAEPGKMGGWVGMARLGTTAVAL